MKIETSPPLRFRAVPHDNPSESIIFTHDDIRNNVGETSYSEPYLYYQSPDRMRMWRKIFLASCDINQSTGHHDSEGKEVFGGDVGDSKHAYWLVRWDSRNSAFNLRFWLKSNLQREDFTYAECVLGATWDSLDDSIVIGNIHNPDALPEKVRKLLMEADDEICI